MLCRHTLPLLLLLALSSSTFAHLRPRANRERPSRRNYDEIAAVAAPPLNSSSASIFQYSEEKGQCPHIWDPPPLSELHTMIEGGQEVLLSYPALTTCLSEHNCAAEGVDPCAPEGLCATAGPDVRLRRARQLRLEHCPHLTLFSVMSLPQREALDSNSSTNCCAIARHLRERDVIVRKFLRLHQVFLRRSNFENSKYCDLGSHFTKSMDICGTTLQQGCVTCEEAYRRWVCSELFVYHDGEGCPVKPCESICRCVEQKCPYFLPQEKPVAGEPSFLCEDPSMRIIDEKTWDPRCYEPCSYEDALGILHEKTNATGMALCVHSGTHLPPICTSHFGAGPQCLTSAPGLHCGCCRTLIPSVIVVWTCLLLVEISKRTLFLRPRGFT